MTKNILQISHDDVAKEGFPEMGRIEFEYVQVVTIKL